MTALSSLRLRRRSAVLEAAAGALAAIGRWLLYPSSRETAAPSEDELTEELRIW